MVHIKVSPKSMGTNQPKGVLFQFFFNFFFIYFFLLDSAFTQQRIPGWFPIMTPLKVISWFYVLGIIFVVFGILFMLNNNTVFFLFLFIPCEFHFLNLSSFFILNIITLQKQMRVIK